jgi:hypothetical protein
MVQVLGVEVQPTVMKEPVLEVPAIDMTDAAKPQAAPGPMARSNQAAGAKAQRKPRKAAVSRPGRSVRSKKASADRPPSRIAKADQSKQTRDGSVGRDTFQQVEALLKQGKNKTQAFNQVAADTGRNSGTVAANYYRVARVNGAVKPRKALATATSTTARRKTAQSVRRPSNSRSDNSAQGVDQILGQVLASVQALTEAVKAQDAEVQELRGRPDGARSLLS